MEEKLSKKVSRRTFLKGAAAGMALLGPGVPYIVKRAVAAEEKIGWHAPWPYELPKAGVNPKYENAKIVKRYDKTNANEIKGMVPDIMIEWLTTPDKWGPFYMNETEPIKFEPPPGFAAATEKNFSTGKCKVREDGALLNWEAGTPFKDPKTGWEVIWNAEKRYHGDDWQHPYVGVITDKNHKVQHWIKGAWRRIYFAGRTETDPKPIYPNSEGLELFDSFGYSDPYDMRGLIPLYHRYLAQLKPDDQWMYIPSMRRTRRMSTAQRYDAIGLGFDMCWDDFQNFAGKVMQYNWKLIGRRETLVPTLCKAKCEWAAGFHLAAPNDNYNRVNAYVIECIPKDPNHIYSKKILWIDPETWFIPYGEYFDQKGKLWRVWHNHSTYDSKMGYFPADMAILDVQRMHSSNCYVFGSTGNTNLTPEMFSWEYLKKIYPSEK
jgi:hypothetical protein